MAEHAPTPTRTNELSAEPPDHFRFHAPQHAHLAPAFGSDLFGGSQGFARFFGNAQTS